jgi:SAM-dependent methyltransferase
MDSNEVRRIREVQAERDRAHKSNSGNPGRQRTLRERSDAMERILGKRLERPLSECRILDIGCGRGSVLSWFHEREVPSENLFGIDLMPDRIKTAREAYPGFTFIEGNAEQLAFPDDWFDLVLCFTVFSSILDDAMAKNVARSIGRVLKNNGMVVWHDFRYPNPCNSAVRAMTKSRIRRLFPSFELELELIYLLPPIAYHLGRFTDWVYPMLASVPVLRSHYFGLLCPRPNI